MTTSPVASRDNAARPAAAQGADSPSSARNAALDQARVQLAAAHRLAALHELDEGIDNHFTVAVPGAQDEYLILPFGRHWSEARASDMMVFNEAGDTVSGSGPVELSAQCIHAPIHRISGAAVVMHTHQTWATALNMLQDNRLFPLSQTAAFFDGHVAYDDNYSGLADTLEEGERLAHLLGNKHVVLMKNHGALVVGDTVAQAYRRLYRLERVCRMQLIAMAAASGSGGQLAVLGADVVERVQAINPHDSHSRADRERLFFEAMMRVLDRELPGYRD
ncbi:MAG: class II aldolase/adducin family protein [Rhodoferax sp.]|nr:class II aldolase/adducin family protein [Rhodoferax sp.]